GMTTYHQICNGFAPSIMAASSKSLGRVDMNWRNKNTNDAPPAKKPGMVMGLNPGIQSNRKNNTYCGMSVAWGGSMRVAIIIANTILRPRHCKRLKAYATKHIESTVPNNTIIT